MKYPFLDLKTVNAPMMAQLKEAACGVIDSGRYIGGPEVEAFEAELARKTGADHAVGVSNGLDALRLIFKAYIALGRLKPGDGVIVPANTYIASVLAVTDAGLEPVFADASLTTLNLDEQALESAYTPEVKAVLTVHLYGRPCGGPELLDFVRRHGLLLIEDNAQALGAATGNIGDAAGVSFYPTKNIGALGDAGAVLTRHAELAVMVRTLANYGSDVRYHNIYEGYNCRLDTLQAAMLRVKLRYLEAETARRRRLAAVYETGIHHPAVRKPLMENPDPCVWHQYPVLVPDRADFRNYLNGNGVGSDVNYPTPVHLQPCYSRYSGARMPVAEQIARQVVCLPISACTSEADAAEISAIINAYKG